MTGTTTTGTSRRWAVALVLALVAALGVCTAQAVAIHQFRDPRPETTLGVGGAVELDGVRFRLDAFTVAARLPAREKTDPPVAATAGAVLLQIVLTVEVVDPARDLTAIYCDLTLVDDSGRRWTRASDIEYRLAAPERVTCASSTDLPVRIRQPYEVGAAFTVPATAADTVRLRLRSGQQVADFRR